MQTTLYYKDDRSDKVYTAEMVEKDGGFVVNFAYGRRGSAQTPGTKTNVPVSEAKAKDIFDKLIAEKVAKGYTPGEDGTPYTQGSNERSGVLPQLLNAIDDRELQRLLTDDNWVAQEKKDGRRLMVRRGETVEAINRKGLIVGAPKEILDNITQIPGRFILDGELVGDIYWVFDILPFDGEPMRLEERLRCLWIVSIKDFPNIQVVETAAGTQYKTSLYARLYTQKAEGIVFKRVGSIYKPGRPASGGDMVKYKFYATCTARVRKVNDQRSVEVELWSGATARCFDAVRDWQTAGNVTIPANFSIPSVGDIVEIRYLYATQAGILYQPVYMGERSDVGTEACLRSQLKAKPTEDDEQ